METTKEERERWAPELELQAAEMEAAEVDDLIRYAGKLARDVDALVGIVRKLEGCADWESEDAATLNVTEFRIALEQARAVLGSDVSEN